jgi:hypothetical protein
MRKLLFTIVTIAFMATCAFGQNADYKAVISANAGLTIMGALNSEFDSESAGAVNTTTLPSLELAFDYGIEKWFSLGVIFAYQLVSAEEQVTGFTNNYSISRTYVGLSTLFHYANSGKVDLYSGFRLGFKKWNTEIDFDEGFDDTGYNYVEIGDLPLIGDGFGFQFVTFGIRGYLTDNIGISAELLTIGAPHIASIGLSYRL